MQDFVIPEQITAGPISLLHQSRHESHRLGRLDVVFGQDPDPGLGFEPAQQRRGELPIERHVGDDLGRRLVVLGIWRGRSGLAPGTA